MHHDTFPSVKPQKNHQADYKPPPHKIRKTMEPKLNGHEKHEKTRKSFCDFSRFLWLFIAVYHPAALPLPRGSLTPINFPLESMAIACVRPPLAISSTLCPRSRSPSTMF